MQDAIYAGIDISKAWCDVALDATSDTARFDQTPTGRAGLVVWLVDHGVTHVVVEASGGYERAVLRAIDAAGLHACLVPPHRVRSLARACGHLAKTDVLDARLLAAFGRLIQPRIRQSQSEHMQALAALVRRRRQIVDMMTLEDNRQKQEDDAAILADIVALRLVLKAQLDVLDRRIANQIADDPALGDKHRVLMAFKGVGPSPARCCWPRCRSWASSTPSRPRAWRAWRRSTMTAAPRPANDPSMAGGPACAARFIWPR